MAKPLCDICGSRHESYQAHVFASNTASNKESHASNRVAGDVVRRSDVVVASGGSLDQGVKKQRWSRESYNAYQREYMRKKRLKARG